MELEEAYQSVIDEHGEYIGPAEKLVEGAGRLFEGLTQKLSGKSVVEQNEEVRSIGAPAVLNGQEVYWAGQNYGWQSKASFKKLYDEGEFRTAQITGSRIMSSIGRRGKELLEATPEPVKDAAFDVLKTGVTKAAEAYYSLPLYQQQDIERGVRIAGGVARFVDDRFEDFSRFTGVSRYITDEVATTLLTAGAGTALKKTWTAGKPVAAKAIRTVVEGVDDVFPPGGAPQLATAAAGAAPTPTTPRVEIDRGVVRIVTVPERQWATATREAAGEVASVPQYADALKARTKTIKQAEARIPEWAEQVRLAEEAVAANRTRATQKDLKYAKGKLKTARDDLSRAISTLRTQDEHFFAWGWLQKKPDQLGFRKPDLIGGQWEKHHLFHKGESTEIYNRLEELILEGKATTDDLVNMMLRAREQGAATGDAFTNLILSHKKGSHSPYHASRITDPAGIRGLPVQPSRKQLRKVLSELNSAEELQDFMDEYIEKVVLPGKQKMFKMELDYRKASGNYDVEDLIEGIREGL